MPIIEESSRDDEIYRIRHSLSHVMAQAVQKLYPGTLLGFGPPIDDGFYYDFLFPESAEVGEEAFPEIEQEMKRIIKEKQEFLQEDLPISEAVARIEAMQEPHKLEYARELIETQGLDTLRFFTNGPFVDMCEGPHVESTARLPKDGFKLHSLAGAYWRGDEKRVMLTRIYAYAYKTRKEVRARVAAVEQAKKNHHIKLGKELKIFTFSDEVGKGLPLWLPHGEAIRRELEKLAYEMEFAAGYVHVATPHITKAKLFYTSGHLPLYKDGMYPPMKVDDDEGEGAGQDGESDFYLRPMNCPFHHEVYASEKRSYRDLPLRLSEYGCVYRYEKAGALQGLARVRGMTMNDAHIYVTEDQMREEFKAVLDLHRRYYEIFQFDDYFLRLSLWDPNDPKKGDKYFDNPEAWEKTEKILRETLEDLGLYYKVGYGEAAFYGPKVDFQFKSVLEKEYTVSTNQLDFGMPARFDLTYTDSDGTAKTPYCIHRAPLGTHERFIAFLIEHYGGAFPTWLAPVQVQVIPVSEKHMDYARRVQEAFRGKLIRAEIDERDEKMGKKIREGSIRKIPVLLIAGGKEEETGTVTLRRYGIKEQRSMELSAAVDQIATEIAKREHVKEW